MFLPGRLPHHSCVLCLSLDVTVSHAISSAPVAPGRPGGRCPIVPTGPQFPACPLKLAIDAGLVSNCARGTIDSSSTLSDCVILCNTVQYCSYHADVMPCDVM